MNIDYQNLHNRLMLNYPVLVSLKLTEVKNFSSSNYKNATVYDLSENCKNKKYYVGNYNTNQIVIILKEIKNYDKYTENIWKVFNCYYALIKNGRRTLTFNDIKLSSQKIKDSDRQIHWIWFRHKGFYLPNKIMNRVKSWIVLNKDFKFYLWTNIKDKEELLDFISKLKEEYQQLFLNGIIIVKYTDETNNCFVEFSEKYGDQLDSRFLETYLKKLNNGFKINVLFKTDILRAIVLCLYGGIYADFNDTICLYPLKYLLPMYDNEYFLGCDTTNPILRNNYFIYNSLGNMQFLDLSIKIINSSITEYYRISSPTYIKLYVDTLIELIQNLGNHDNETDNFAVNIFCSNKLENIEIILQDKNKNIPRIISLIIDIIYFLSDEISILKLLSDRLNQELSVINQERLKNKKIYIMRRKRRKKLEIVDLTQLKDSIDIHKITELTSTDEFYNHFLLNYAKIMINGDLILSTNIAYIQEHENLVFKIK